MDQEFEPGMRVELVHTEDRFTRLTPGTQGTVIDEAIFGGVRVVDVEWDDGSSLAMLIDEGDAIKVVDDEQTQTGVEKGL